MKNRPKSEMTIKDLARDLAMGSVVTDCLARFIEQVMTEVHDTKIAPCHKALRALLAKPHGCIYCDSGHLRNDDRSHDDDCGFYMASQVLR